MRVNTSLKNIMLTAAILCVAVGLLITLGAIGTAVADLWTKLFVGLVM